MKYLQGTEVNGADLKLKVEASLREQIRELILELRKRGSKRVKSVSRRIRITNRVRGGKVQRRKRVSNVAGFTVKGKKLTRISDIKRRKSSIKQKRASIKRKAKKGQIQRKRKISLRKRKRFGG